MNTDFHNIFAVKRTEHKHLGTSTTFRKHSSLIKSDCNFNKCILSCMMEEVYSQTWTLNNPHKTHTGLQAKEGCEEKNSHNMSSEFYCNNNNNNEHISRVPFHVKHAQLC